MGTRFMATREAPIHDKVKQKLVESDERSTALILRTMRNTSRVFGNSVAKKAIEMEHEADHPEIARSSRAPRVRSSTRPATSSTASGRPHVMGLIADIRPARSWSSASCRAER